MARNQHRAAIMAERWRQQVKRFLDGIQADQWQGSPRETADALAAVATHGDRPTANPVPLPSSVADWICECGWTLLTGRTGSGRFVRFVRIQKAE